MPGFAMSSPLTLFRRPTRLKPEIIYFYVMTRSCALMSKWMYIPSSLLKWTHATGYTLIFLALRHAKACCARPLNTFPATHTSKTRNYKSCMLMTRSCAIVSKWMYIPSSLPKWTHATGYILIFLALRHAWVRYVKPLNTFPATHT